MIKRDASYWVKQLEMEAHPEGGYFKEVYRSDEEVDGHALPARFGGSRAFGTSIYFLLGGDDFSAFHRLDADEIWHFYDGCPLLIHMLLPDGSYRSLRLGKDIEAGELPQQIVPANAWFAALPTQSNSFTLVGCTMAPAFDFRGFELASQTQLSQQFLKHSELIARFCIRP